MADIILPSAGTVGITGPTAPTADGDIIQVLGYATHLDRMYFDPDLTLVEHA